jgi:hypothetical protein
MLGLEGGELLPFVGPVLVAVTFHSRNDLVPYGRVRGRSSVDEAVEMEDNDVC